MSNVEGLDLCQDPLIGVSSAEGMKSLTLPEVLSTLGRGEEVEFTGVRPHQQHAWHAFLVQTAALVVAGNQGHMSLDRSPAVWRDGLLALAGKAGVAAWQLVVEDTALPAFMQTPVPEGSLEKASYRNAAETPDAIDVLIAAKNHDVKQARMTAARPEHWIYALVTLQTMQGYLGAGNYGIARMNGGHSSRPAFSYSTGTGWATRFTRDVRVWLENRERLIETYSYRSSGGRGLLWLTPWNGSVSTSLQECDPFFVEICRRIRLVLDGGRIHARFGTSACALLSSMDAHGDTGDIWTPIWVSGKALTVGGDGLSYHKLVDILFSGDFNRNPALKVKQSDGKDLVLIAQVLVRGNGKTDRYRDRAIPVPARARAKLLAALDTSDIGDLAKRRIQQVAIASRSVLHPSLCALLQGGRADLEMRDGRTEYWTSRFDEEVDGRFFDDLWASIDLPQEERDSRWDHLLLNLAREQLRDAVQRSPRSDASRYRAVARAELIFNGASRRNLSSAFQVAKEGTDNA